MSDSDKVEYSIEYRKNYYGYNLFKKLIIKKYNNEDTANELMLNIYGDPTNKKFADIEQNNIVEFKTKIGISDILFGKNPDVMSLSLESLIVTLHNLENLIEKLMANIYSPITNTNIDEENQEDNEHESAAYVRAQAQNSPLKAIIDDINVIKEDIIQFKFDDMRVNKPAKQEKV